MKYWQIFRTLIFIFVGLINTIFIRTEDIGSWKNYIGYILLLLALYDVTVITTNYIKSRKEIKN